MRYISNLILSYLILSIAISIYIRSLVDRMVESSPSIGSLASSSSSAALDSPKMARNSIRLLKKKDEKSKKEKRRSTEKVGVPGK